MDPAEAARIAATVHGTDFSKVPKFQEINAESITPSVHDINENCTNERSKFIFKSLVNHLHDFVRETSLTTEEWMTAIEFLTATGKTCTDLRQEFILLSDTLGVSSLVQSLNAAKPANATEGTVLGPFFETDAHDFKYGESIASEGKGHYMYVEGTVTDTKGNPIAGATIETWESDGDGKYDNQYEVRDHPDCRGRLTSEADGTYAYRAVVPVPYGIPDDGPVAAMLGHLGRHIYRPSHLHMQVTASGYETLITAFYFEGDPYLTSDAVFGVRTSLVVKTQVVDDKELAKARGFPDTSKPHVYLKQNLILPTVEEAKAARKELQLRLGQKNVYRLRL